LFTNERIAQILIYFASDKRRIHYSS